MYFLTENLKTALNIYFYMFIFQVWGWRRHNHCPREPNKIWAVGIRFPRAVSYILHEKLLHYSLFLISSFLRLVFRPLGLPVLRKIRVHNLNGQSSIQMLSISGNTIHFHCSFFTDKVRYKTPRRQIHSITPRFTVLAAGVATAITVHCNLSVK